MRRSTILLVEEDDDTRPIFKEYLIKNGYNVIPTIDEEDAVGRINDEHLQIDLILVDVVGKPTGEALNTGHRIRQFRESDVPLVVIAAEYDEELASEIVQAGVNEYVVYLEDGDELTGLLAQLVKSKHAENTAKLA